MAEVTVKQLAETVGTSVDSLLAQMREAGLSHTDVEETVSDKDKQVLLAFLKSNHGSKASATPKKITLKRKTVSTLKTSGASGRKTVNVEVRKKRTYIKRSEVAEEKVEPEKVQDVAAPETSIEEKTAAAEQSAPAKQQAAETERAEAEAKVAAADAAVAEKNVIAEKESKKEAAQPAPAKDSGSVLSDDGELDLEKLRQRAVARRKEEDQQRQQDLEEIREQKRIELEAKKVAEAEKARVAAEESEKAKPKKGSSLRLKVGGESDEDRERRKASRGRMSRSRGKERNHNIRVTEDYEIEERNRHRSRTKLTKTSEQKRHGFEQPLEERVYTVELSGPIAVKELAQKMNIKVGSVVKSLMSMGVMANINEIIDEESAELVVNELGHNVVHVSQTLAEDNLLDHLRKKEGTPEPRAPVVTVMGHVDHGKTSLLDYIRKTRVASGEAGGITQHIGAYHVETEKGMITFLDTPGHAAFTAMRARGAKSTDVVILIVAADDGVMPQTEEAIQHARAAEVPIVVAINKIDKEGADPDRVKNELSAKDVIPEDWGGDVQFIHVSAHTGEGIDELLDAVLLQAEILELKAPRDVNAQGIVIESRLDKGRGAVTSVLVQKGVLRKGEMLLAGSNLGRIRAMMDENGDMVDEVGPSMPVEILGLDGTPNAGDEFFVVQDERNAREVADARAKTERETRLARQHSSKLENLFAGMGNDEKRSLSVLLKTDVRGSLEAIQNALLEMGNDEVEVNIVASGVGGLSETDINLAITSGAVVFGFNVRADNAARDLVEREGVELRYYSVIYDLLDDVKQVLSGMLRPEQREEILGVAEVREVFKSPKFGLIAGSMVVEGSIYRSKPIRVLRDDVVIYEGELESLRRFKDDVQEVRNGMECGIGVKNYQDVRPGDKIEVFEVKEFARTL